MLRSLEARLVKLEAPLRPARGAFFLFWAYTEAGLDEAIATAIRSGQVRNGDAMVRAVWPLSHSMPESRWIAKEIGSLGRAEFGALTLEAWRRHDGWIKGLCAGIEPDEDPRPYGRPDYLKHMHDAELFATVLGERLGEKPAPKPPSSEPALVRFLQQLRGIELRDSIRGCRRALQTLSGPIALND